jgi:hypothetical protein
MKCEDPKIPWILHYNNDFLGVGQALKPKPRVRLNQFPEFCTRTLTTTKFCRGPALQDRQPNLPIWRETGFAALAEVFANGEYAIFARSGSRIPPMR